MKSKQDIELLKKSAEEEIKRSGAYNAMVVNDVCGWVLETEPEILFDNMVAIQKLKQGFAE